MTLNILPNAVTQFFDSNGNPLASGSVYMYVPNTSTFKTTWQDIGGTIANSNPIILDAAGECLLFGSGEYRQLVKDSLGNTIWDSITADPAFAVVASFSGTSTTSVLIGTGTKSFVTQTGLQFFPGGILIVASNANASNYMIGSITGYNSQTGSLTLNVSNTGGSGTFNDWNISITGLPGSVSAISVATANGFKGTSSGGGVPQITLGTTITGILKGNGNAVSAAVGDTDYQNPIRLTTTGSTGPATFIGDTLNIPQYSISQSFSTLTSGTNLSAAMVVGSGATLAPAGTGVILANNIGGTITSGTNITITGSGTSSLPYVISSSGAGSSGFNTISSGTNTTAAMVVGSGASLSASGTGTVTPTTVNGLLVAGTNVTLSGAGTVASPYTIASTNTASTAFSALSGSTNTTAAMVVGSGASLSASGTGTVTPTTVNGLITAGTAISLTGAGTVASPYNIATSAVTTTGSPASGNLAQFSGAGSITNTDLTGDITTSGTVATTLASVNSNVGTFNNATITVNAKGLVTAASTGTSAGVSPPAQGRLTLTSNIPVLITTVSGAGTVYFTPYLGNQVPIYNGSTFTPAAFSQLSNILANSSSGNAGPAAVTTNSNYDLFVWNNSGTITLTRGPLWTSATARGTGAGTTQISNILGIWVNTAAITNGPAAGYGTYVGTITTNGSSTVDFKLGAAAPGGSAANIGIWNNYNRITYAATVQDTTTSWTYGTNTFRAANNSNSNRVTYVIGLSEEIVQCSYAVALIPLSAITIGTVAVGQDSTTFSVGAAGQIASTASSESPGTAISSVGLSSGLGLHYIQALEAASSDWIFYGAYNGVSAQALSVIGKF